MTYPYSDNKLIFKCITGSRAYGTSTPDSDTDIKGVYVQPIDGIITLFNYREVIAIDKDETYFEIGKFLKLLMDQVPNALEMLYSPQDCILEMKPEFQLLLEHRDKFLTKKCKESFGGYAMGQIKKAKGLDKKMNWEQERIERKTPVDFVYVYVDGKTISLKNWLDERGFIQERCGLVALNHFRDCYALYYDNLGYLDYRGVSFDDSNTVHLSSVPAGLTPHCIVFYNKDAYSVHCKEFREYSD